MIYHNYPINDTTVGVVSAYLANEASSSEVINLWCDYASEDYPDSYIYNSLEDMSELFGGDAHAFARAVYFGDVNSWNDNYFIINDLGNVDSFNYADDDRSPIDFDYLARKLLEESAAVLADIEALEALGEENEE